MKTLSLFSIFLFISASMLAQTFTGKVTDSKTGEPITGAYVVIDNTTIGSTTDLNGDFSLKGTQEEATLEISFVGYQSQRVKATANQEIAVNLQPTALDIDEVVVTGSRLQVARKNVPLTVSVISQEAIESSGESALLPVISEHVPGLFVTERGVTGFGVAEGSAGQISIRGVGGSPNTQVLVLIDGHPQYMGIFGHPLPDAYVASDVEKVEVIRGPASILYGSNAMGGVINIITKKQKDEGFKGQARASYGSYNTQKYMASGGYHQDKFSVLASVNYDYTDGHRDNSQFDIVNSYTKATYRFSNHLQLNVDANLAQFKSYDPGPESEPYLDEEHWVDITRGKAAISFENTFENTDGALKLFYNFGEHDIYDGFHSTDYNFGSTFYQGVHLWSGNMITAGVDYKNYGGKAENTLAMNGEGMVFGDETLSETGLYTFIQQNFWDKLVLNTGLRLEINEIYGQEWIPQAGMAFHPSNSTTIKASVSKGFRSPTIRELYLWAPANEDLEPERMINYEAGITQQLFDNQVGVELTFFVAEGDNMIQTLFINGAPINKNSGEFSNKGIEFASNFRINSHLRLTANYTYLDMKEPVLAAPEQQLFLGIKYHKSRFAAHINGQYINGLVTRLDSENAPLITEDYFLLNARVNYQLTEWAGIFLNANNLLDSKYQINYDYPMPGITFSAGVNMKF